MTKIKFSILSTIIILVTSLVTISCTNSDDTTLNEDQSFKRNSIIIQNKTYIADKGTTSKYVNNVLEYKLIKPSTLKGKMVSFKNNNDGFRITNDLTNEFIDVINVEFHTTYYTFDIINNEGNSIDNITFYIGDEINKSNPWLPIIGVIVDAIVDALVPSPLQECQAAMNSLNCSGGSNPYMEFSEGWFSTTCNVGCSQN